MNEVPLYWKVCQAAGYEDFLCRILTTFPIPHPQEPPCVPTVFAPVQRYLAYKKTHPPRTLQ